jgi:hypothetical protein
MPSGSSSPGVSTRSFVLVFTLAAALSAVPPAQAEFRSDLDGASSRPARVAMAWNPLAELYEGRYAFAEGILSDSTVTEPAPKGEPAPATAEPTPAPVETSPPPAAIQPERSAARADKNPKKALLLSFLLPGAGEMYSGHNGRATGFFISEGVIWANYVTWQIAAHLRRDNYVEQARLNAGMGTTSESDDFWRLVGLYTRSSGSGPDSYEDALRRDARNEFPSDPAAQDAWVAERLPTGNRAWNWTSAEAQKNFRDTRHSSTRAFQHAKYSFALAILNRVASVIDTQMLHRKDQKADQSSIDGPRLRILTDMTADGGGMLLVRSTF